MIIITQARIKTIIADCKTEADLEATLRHHRLRHKYTTETGFMSCVIPSRTGSVRIYRTASRSNPFKVEAVKPEPFYFKKLDNYSCL